MPAMGGCIESDNHQPVRQQDDVRHGLCLFLFFSKNSRDNEGVQASALAKAGDASQPVLYVQFRRDGIPVDPGPWWAVNEGQKVRG